MRQVEDDGERAALLTKRGSLYEEQGQYQKALDDYRKALDINESQHNDPGTVICLRHLGSACREMGRLEEAATHLSRALSVLEALGGEDKPELIEVQNLLGAVREDQGHADEALGHYRKALDIAQALNHAPGEADTLSRMGSAHAHRGEYQKAIENLRRAIEICEKLDDSVALSQLYGDLGEVYEEQGDLDEAIREYSEALRKARLLESRPMTANALIGLGHCHAQIFNIEQARQEFDEAQSLLEGMEGAVLQARLSLGLGRIHDLEGHSRVAYDCYLRSLEALRDVKDSRRMATCHRLLRDSALRFGDLELAIAHQREAYQWEPNTYASPWSVLIGDLHPQLDPASVSFRAGDYQSAVTTAFRSCEEAFKHRYGAERESSTTDMIKECLAVGSRGGLSPFEYEVELKGFRDMAVGAFQACRNPLSHRLFEVSQTDAFCWIAVAHLILSLMCPPAQSVS